MGMGLAVLGGSLYKNTAEAGDENTGRRIALSYIANRLRGGDAAGSVSVGSFHGADALILNEDYGGVACVTYIYCWDGALREMFVQAGVELAPETGVAVLPAQALSLSADEEGLISVVVTDENGVESTLSLSPRCGLTGGEAG